MATQTQLARLASQIEELKTALGVDKVEYVIYMRWTGETDEEFYARYPDYPRDGRGIIDLTRPDVAPQKAVD